MKTNQNKIKGVGESLVLVMFGKNCIHFQKVQCFLILTAVLIFLNLVSDINNYKDPN